jgi:N-methylhydantoinase A
MIHGRQTPTETRNLMAYRIGADIGGTFTDIVLVDEAGGAFHLGKVLTTPEAPERAVVEGTRELLRQSAVAAGNVGTVIHGTTLFTNALIERKGSKTALVTTRGFRDAVEIGREHRYDMYDLAIERPKPLAPRHLRFEVTERILVDGTVRTPLDEAEVEKLALELVGEGVEAVAVCLLHSYVDPRHERRIGEILARLAPGLALTLSADLVPELREYERGSTTLANVYVKRLASSYLRRLGHGLAEQGIAGDLFVMASNGGLVDVEAACAYPVRLVESGPAAGALAAAHYGRLLGHPDLLSFDMGGTTAKASVIAGGEPLVAPEFEVDRQYQFKKGSGLPVKVPVIEMIEIGTGGGSIARVDALGRLLVGPDSAGAEPGPTCYGRGGELPTVTDADLVLGYLDPAFFLGGRMPLDLEAARRAIHDRVAKPLGLPLEDAAMGIHRLANETMASAARIHCLERGKDIAKLPLFAFGGAGPVHAWGVASILGGPEIIYPFGAGVMSAVGFLVAPLAFDFVRTQAGGLDELDWAEIEALFGGMEEEGRKVLGRTTDPGKIGFRRFADMRYRKQGYEIRVPLPEGRLDRGRLAAVQAAFERAYGELYGHIVPGAPVDAVSWRLVAQGPKPELRLPGPEQGRGSGDARKGSRRIWLAGEGWREVPVLDRYGLTAGERIEGPAVIEERESTVVVAGPAKVRVDEINNLIVELRPAA